MSTEMLLEETLIKRSQQKKRTSPLNYKERLFVLTRSRLTYYDGKAEKKFRRGSIELSRVRCVEIVKNGGGIIPCQNKYPFQVVYDTNTLYVFAPSHDSRSLWVQSLKEEIKDNPVVWTKFHPQFWQDGAWLCCRQAEKQAPGCEEYNPFGDSKKQMRMSSYACELRSGPTLTPLSWTAVGDNSSCSARVDNWYMFCYAKQATSIQ